MRHASASEESGDTGSVPPASSSETSRSTVRSSDPRPIGSGGVAVGVDTAPAFAAAEALRQAQRGVSTDEGARDVLRWASRRRSAIETAIERLRADEGVDASTRNAAIAILDRVIACGLLY